MRRNQVIHRQDSPHKPARSDSQDEVKLDRSVRITGSGPSTSSGAVNKIWRDFPGEDVNVNTMSAAFRCALLLRKSISDTQSEKTGQTQR